MCLMPGFGRSRISSVTSTPPSTSSNVAVPLTPESRLGVSWTLVPCVPWAKALPSTTTAANKAMPRTKPANRAVWCTVFPLRYLVPAAAVLSGGHGERRSKSQALSFHLTQHFVGEAYRHTTYSARRARLGAETTSDANPE